MLRKDKVCIDIAMDCTRQSIAISKLEHACLIGFKVEHACSNVEDVTNSLDENNVDSETVSKDISST